MSDNTPLDLIKDLTLDEKVEAARLRFKNADPSARAQIDSWELQILQLRSTSEWLKHPTTVQLKDMLEGVQRRMLSVLMTDSMLPDFERKVYFKTIDALVPLLVVLGQSTEDQLASIEQAINQNLI